MAETNVQVFSGTVTATNLIRGVAEEAVRWNSQSETVFPQSATTRYYKIATLGTIGGGSNGGKLRISGTIGGFSQTETTLIDAFVASRAAIKFGGTLTGYGSGNPSDVDFVVYLESDGTFAVWLKLIRFYTFDFTISGAQVSNNTRTLAVLPCPTTDTSVTTPTGTLQGSVVDSCSVVFTDDGNVGIGTTDPQDVTHIYKDGANDDHGLLIEQNNAGTGSATLKFGVAHTTESTAGLSKAGIFFKRGDTNGRGDLLFCMDNADDTNDVDTSNHALTIYRDGNVGIGTTEPVSGLTVFRDIESTNSFITERVLFKETWPNGLNSLVGDLGTWVVTNLNQQSGPSVETTPDGYGIVAFNGGTGVANGEFVSPAFDLSDYAIVDGTLQADNKRKTTTRVFMKFWLGTRQLDSNGEVLQVQFSPDNGTTWYTVATSQDRLSTDRFTMVSADLSPYILSTGTPPQAKIRFYMPWLVGEGDYIRIGRMWIHESDVPTNLGGMWLGAGGNIGIGTASPAGKLHVETPLGTSTNLVKIASSLDSGSSQSVSGIEFAGNPAFFNNDNTQRVPAQITSGFYDGGSADWGDGYISLRTPDDPSDGTLIDILTVRGGNVGIGTTNPTGTGVRRLEGSSTTGFEYIATRDDTTVNDGNFIGGYLFKNADTAGTAPHFAGMTAYAFGASGNMDLRFYAGRDVYEDTPLEPHMTIAKSGSVGIGTTDPLRPFDVADQNGSIDNPVVVFRANRDGASNGDGNVLKVENSGARTDAELYDALSNDVRQFSVKASGRCEAREFDVATLAASSFLGGDGGSSDGIFSRPDGQVYISVDDDFYFRDNADTTATRRGYMDTNAGDFKVTGGFDSSASLDYAEYFEWYDGNPDNEDRIGYSVSLFPGTDMIKKCEEGETPIGIVSGTSGFTGGGADIYWKGYWEQDAWGRPVYAQQLVHGEPVFNEDGTPKMKRVVNPDWDSTSMDTYIPRKDRKEWACVGLLGQVLMRPECIHSPFWTKMKSVDSEKDLWLISLFPSINKDVENDLEVEKAKTTSLETQLASVLARLDALESA